MTVAVHGEIQPVKPNPILDFGIDTRAIRFVGEGLQRPECILAEPDGTLWVADARGGVARLDGDGQEIITQRRSGHFQDAGDEATRYLRGTLPNGLAFARNEAGRELVGVPRCLRDEGLCAWTRREARLGGECPGGDEDGAPDLDGRFASAVDIDALVAELDRESEGAERPTQAPLLLKPAGEDEWHTLAGAADSA